MSQSSNVSGINIGQMSLSSSTSKDNKHLFPGHEDAATGGIKTDMTMSMMQGDPLGMTSASINKTEVSLEKDPLLDKTSEAETSGLTLSRQPQDMSTDEVRL